jgi:hypothetical protein
MDEKGVNKYTAAAITSVSGQKEDKPLILNLKSYIWNGQSLSLSIWKTLYFDHHTLTEHTIALR